MQLEKDSLKILNCASAKPENGYTDLMEKEAVAEIAGLFGWGEHLGHLAGGGTLANMGALWDAGKLNACKKVGSLHRTFQNPGRWH